MFLHFDTTVCSPLRFSDEREATRLNHLFSTSNYRLTGCFLTFQALSRYFFDLILANFDTRRQQRNMTMGLFLLCLHDCLDETPDMLKFKHLPNFQDFE